MRFQTGTFREWIRDQIKPELRDEIKDADIDKAMGAFLESVPDYKLDLLLELRSQYRVFLLSNTQFLLHLRLLNHISSIKTDSLMIFSNIAFSLLKWAWRNRTGRFLYNNFKNG